MNVAKALAAGSFLVVLMTASAWSIGLCNSSGINVQRPLLCMLSDNATIADVNVACFGILKCLADVVAVNQLRSHPVPNAGTLQCLLCGESVWRVIRIRDGNALDFRPREIRNAVESDVTHCVRPQRNSAARIDRLRVRNDQSLLFQLIDVTHVRRRKQIHRRAVFDLPREQTSRAERQKRLLFCEWIQTRARALQMPA